MTAQFSQSAVNEVLLTLTANLPVGTQFIAEVNFNVDPSVVPSLLTIVQTGGKIATITKTTQNAQALAGSGSGGTGFDIELAFSTSGSGGGALRFRETDVATFKMTRSFGLLTPEFFAFTNTGSAAAHVGAHIQGIPGAFPSGAVKETAPTPEPSSLALICGALALAALRRTFKRA